MKNFVTIALSMLGIWTMLTGIMDSDFHIFAALALTGILCIHIWLNRKLFFQRFKGLGWSWVLVGLGMLAIIATTGVD
jgi:hypothetical protein